MTTVAPAPSGSQAPRYLDPIPGIIPFGTVTLIAGASGAGKTTLIVEWCARLLDGRSIWQRATNKPTGIFYLSADRRWREDHQRWLDKVGLSDLPHYSLAEDRQIPSKLWTSSDHALDLFDYCVGRLSPANGSLLIIDPITPFFIAGDSNSSRAVARSLIHFNHLCRDREITVWATAYFGKQKGDPREQYTRPIDRVAGAGTFSGYSHTQVYIIEPVPSQQPNYLLGWRPRHGDEESFRYMRQKGTGLFVPYVASIATTARAEKILALFPKDQIHLTTKELIEAAKAIPLHKSKVHEALNELEATGQIIRVRHGTYFRPTIN